MKIRDFFKKLKREKRAEIVEVVLDVAEEDEINAEFLDKDGNKV